VKPQATQQEELIIEYSLAESKAGLGELCPVLKDANGEIIDGFHRKGENASWREETLPWIDTPVKLELARLAVNFNRRRVTPQEISERITFLIKAGVKPDEIANQTGISKATVYRYMPQTFKSANAVKIAKGLQAKREVSRDTCSVTTHDSIQMPSPI
jgi:predicted transcriptional regulator YheO